MENSNNKPVYDLEERTYTFAKNVRQEMKSIKKEFYNEDDVKQLIRSSGSVGANYIEANESFSKKDFNHRIKICRKESKESAYWLRLINDSTYDNENKNLKKIISGGNRAQENLFIHNWKVKIIFNENPNDKL